MKTSFTIGLEYVSRSRGNAEARLLLGESIPSWFSVMRSWPYGLEDLRLYPVAGSATTRAPWAVFVVLPGSEPVPEHPRALPYQRVGRKVYIPWDARLAPPVSDEELDALVSYDLALWHPQKGLTGFDFEEGVMALDLVQAPVERKADFSWAHPGYRGNERLYSITPAASPAIEILLCGGEEESEGFIGDQPAQDLPPTPEEAVRTGGIASWREMMRRRMFEALERWADQAPSSSSRRLWLSRLQEWAAGNLHQQKRRQETELQRLLHLLRTDPDRGLRYAIPLADQRNRGAGPPSDRLAARKPEFRLDRLGGGRPVSPWVVDWRRQLELSKEYREAANRELRLGRHRRAAYIFAELLKDYREAANVLRQGGYFREASVIYLKYLANKLEAAHCLREGAFLVEAIAIYEQQQHYETVADLFERLGDVGESRRFYRLAASRHLMHGQTVKAAHLLETKLDEPEEAIALLQKTWPQSGDALVCLREEMAVYRRLGRPDRRRKRLRALVQDHPPERALGLMSLLGDTALDDPDPEVRAFTENASFTVAGRWLGSPSFASKHEMLGLVRRLAPEDRLLRRDTLRYEERLRERERSAAHPASDGHRVVHFLESVPLPEWIDSWLQTVPCGKSGFYALGWKGHKEEGRALMLMRCRWSGHYQTQRLGRCSAGAARGRLLLSVAHQARPEIASVAGFDDLEPSMMGPSDAFESTLRIENPPWTLQEGFLGMTFSPGGVAWVLRYDRGVKDLVLSSHSSMGDLIATHSLCVQDAVSLEAIGNGGRPVLLVAAREQIFFVLGKRLFRFHRDQLDSLELSAEPESLSCSPDYARLRVAACYGKGVEIVWGDHFWGRRRTVDLGVKDPKVTFTPAGNLIVVSEGRLDVLLNRDGGYVPGHCETLADTAPPLGVFAAEQANTYVIVTTKEILCYRIAPSIRSAVEGHLG